MHYKKNVKSRARLTNHSLVMSVSVIKMQSAGDDGQSGYGVSFTLAYLHLNNFLITSYHSIHVRKQTQDKKGEWLIQNLKIPR